jgi:Flp pilus assembly protein TadB
VKGLVRTPMTGHPGGMDDARHPNGRGWGWVLFALLGLVVLVETVVLAVMASLLSFAVAIAVPVVVLLVAVLIVQNVRRHWVRQDDDATSWEELAA